MRQTNPKNQVAASGSAKAPLADRNARLAELADFYQDCRERITLAEDDAQAAKLTDLALKILKQIRDEAEPATRSDEQGNATGFEHLTDEELIATARALESGTIHFGRLPDLF